MFDKTGRGVRIAAMLAVLAITPVHGASAQPALKPAASAPPAAPAGDASPPRTPVAIHYQVVARYPHDPAAFTEGLLLHDGHLIESTGMEGESQIRIVRPTDGTVIRSVKLPPSVFGEGIVAVHDQLISVTWHGGRGFRWSLPALRQTGSVRYSGEGWGMTTDGHAVILSDGTPELRFLDPASFAETRRLKVTVNGRPLRNLNELEWVDGAIWANVWLSPWIVRIDPATGQVTGAIDIAALMKEAGGDLFDKTPNGIAWDAKAGTLLVTGKRWPTLFALKLEPAS